MWARTVLLTTFLAALFGVALLLRPVPEVERPDIVSGATPPPPPKLFTLTPDEAGRTAAEVAALSILRGGPQFLRRTEGDEVGALARHRHGEWTAADREFGFGTPLAQWQQDDDPPDAADTGRALAALLTRRIIDPDDDVIGRAELVSTWCEAKQSRNPRESFAKCLRDGLDPNDRTYREALACATAIVERNRVPILALANAYSRTVSISQFDDFDVRSYSGVTQREKVTVCEGHRCGAMVHGIVFGEHPLDMLVTSRKGLPAFCAGEPPTFHRSALRGRRAVREAQPTNSANEAYVGMVSRKLVAAYVLHWDQRVLTALPDTHIFNGTLQRTAFWGVAIEMPEVSGMPLIDKRPSLAFATDYAALLGEGEVTRGRDLDGRTTRYATDRAFCGYAVRQALGDAAVDAGRMSVLWDARCASWASGASASLPVRVRRAVAARLHKVEACALALNDANEATVAALGTVLAEHLEISV